MVAVLNPLALTERLRVPDRTILSPSAMAGLLDLSQQELAELAGVHRNSLRVHPKARACRTCYAIFRACWWQWRRSSRMSANWCFI